MSANLGIPPGTITTSTIIPEATVSTVSTPANTGLPLVPMLILLGLFLIIAVGLVFWIFYLRDALTSRDLTTAQSPYCPIIQCPNGTQNTNYNLDAGSETFQTLNFCSISAPPTAFVQGLEVCGGLLSQEDANAGGQNIVAPSAQQVTSFAAFYNQQYVDTCGWSWRNPPPEETTQSQPQGDPVIISLVSCAQALNITGNSDIQQLQSKCGTACNVTTLPILPNSST